MGVDAGQRGVDGVVPDEGLRAQAVEQAEEDRGLVHGSRSGAAWSTNWGLLAVAERWTPVAVWVSWSAWPAWSWPSSAGGCREQLTARGRMRVRQRPGEFTEAELRARPMP